MGRIIASQPITIGVPFAAATQGMDLSNPAISVSADGGAVTLSGGDADGSSVVLGSVDNGLATSVVMRHDLDAGSKPAVTLDKEAQAVAGQLWLGYCVSQPMRIDRPVPGGPEAHLVFETPPLTFPTSVEHFAEHLDAFVGSQGESVSWNQDRTRAVLAIPQEGDEGEGVEASGDAGVTLTFAISSLDDQHTALTFEYRDRGQADPAVSDAEILTADVDIAETPLRSAVTLLNPLYSFVLQREQERPGLAL